MPSELHVLIYGPERGPMARSFDEAAMSLERDLGVYFEPDGSFAKSLPDRGTELFGMLYDLQSRLQYVELRGRLDLETWRVLLRAIAGSQANFVSVAPVSSAAGHGVQNLQDFERSVFASSAGLPE